MNAETERSGIQRTLGIAAFIVALALALIGIGNSSPSFWIIPKMGPYPSAIIRPLILGGAVFLVLVRYPIGPWLLRGAPSLKPAAPGYRRRHHGGGAVGVLALLHRRLGNRVRSVRLHHHPPGHCAHGLRHFHPALLAGLGHPAGGGRDTGPVLFLHRRILAVDLRDRPGDLHRLVGGPVLQPQ